MDKMEEFFDELVSKRLEITIDQYHQKLNPNYWIVDINQALKEKVVDGVAKVRCDAELEKTSTTKHLLMPGVLFSVDVVVPDCPLFQ